MCTKNSTCFIQCGHGLDPSLGPGNETDGGTLVSAQTFHLFGTRKCRRRTFHVPFLDIHSAEKGRGEREKKERKNTKKEGGKKSCDKGLGRKVTKTSNVGGRAPARWVFFGSQYKLGSFIEIFLRLWQGQGGHVKVGSGRLAIRRMPAATATFSLTSWAARMMSRSNCKLCSTQATNPGMGNYMQNCVMMAISGLRRRAAEVVRSSLLLHPNMGWRWAPDQAAVMNCLFGLAWRSF